MVFLDIHEVSVPAAWADLPADVPQTQDDLPDFIKKIIVPCNAQKGDDVPVSEFLPYADGSFPVGSTQYEKRGIAVSVPKWDATKCVQCNRCSLVCPHACIRPYLIDKEEKMAAPESFETKKSHR